MPRTRKPIKVKEPIRLRTKELANGSKSLYLDIYRNGKRTYEYLKMYLIPETDRNARQQNETTMAAGKSSVSCPLKPSDSAPLKHSTMPP